jgi:hypothetical protein
MLYPGLAVGAFIGEAMPGFSLLPAWTGLVIASYVRKMGKESQGGAVLAIASLTAKPSLQSIRLAQQKTNFSAVQKNFRVGNETNVKIA